MSRRAAVALALAFAVSAASSAAAAPLKLPPYRKTTLSNGLTVVILPTKRLPLVDLALVARAGSVYDPAGKEGLAELTASLLTQGAGTRDAKAIAEDIAFVGGVLDAGAGVERLEVSCEVLTKDFAIGLELFRDVVAAPTFAPEEFERRKSETLGRIASDRSEPAAIADNALPAFLYGAGPLAHPGVGSETSVQSLTRDDVVAFHRRYVTPDHSLLAVVGDVDEAVTLAALERAFRDWKPSKSSAAVPYVPLARAAERRVRIVRKPEATQAQIRFACAAVPRGHPDEYPIRVANAILGGGFTSRLVNEIRVVQGLTYSIRSRFDMHRNTGAFTITTFTRNATLRKCVDEVLRSVGTLVEQGPSEAELEKAKRYLVGQYPLGLQAPDDLARALLDVEFYGLEPGTIESFDARVGAVTMEDVRRALKSYFCVNDLQILVVSNPEVARTALQGLGALDEIEIP